MSTGFPTMPPNKGAKADAYLLKPVRLQELLSIIDQETTKNSLSFKKPVLSGFQKLNEHNRYF